MVGLTDPPPPPPPQRLSGANTTPIGTSGASRDAGKGVVDPIAQGFDMMRERFDKLESRLDRTDQRVAASLQLELTSIRPFRVLVGNGASLMCTHVSRHTKLTMQGNLFLVDLHILEHHGPDVILGMAWLESLGKISADFVKKTLEFHRDGKQVFLTGASQGPKEISRQSLAL